jgi:hypothetical protein
VDKPRAYLILDDKQGKVYSPGEDADRDAREARPPAGTWRAV